MCELFAFSSSAATAVRISFAELAAHGGGTGPHRDGWGAAFYQGRDAIIVREPFAAHDSACMHFLLDHPIQSPMVIAHVRKAIRGARSLANTQPFARELGGRLHVFVHNGMVPGIEQLWNRSTSRYEPMGETDSEVAFCVLLARLRPLWHDAATIPSTAARREIVAQFAKELRALGPANFIYCDADALFAHADRRIQLDGAIRPPGLHWWCPDCSPSPRLELAGVEIEPKSASPRMALVASVPLSDQPWLPMASGELIVLREGQRVD